MRSRAIQVIVLLLAMEALAFAQQAPQDAAVANLWATRDAEKDTDKENGKDKDKENGKDKEKENGKDKEKENGKDKEKAPTLEELAKSVESLSKRLTVLTVTEDVKLIIGGQVTADFYFNSARPVAPGVPFFLNPGTPGLKQNSFDANARQTAVYGLITGPKVCETWEPSALVYVNLFSDAVIVDRYGLLPVLAYGQLKNDNWRFAAGLQFDIFNPLNPTTLPFSTMTGSGNAGSAFRGQVRVERFFHPGEDSQITLTAGLSQPVATALTPDVTQSEDNGWPNIEARAAYGFGPMEGEGPEAHRPTELGISGVVGQMRTTSPATGRVVANTWGLGTDIRVALTTRLGVKGEFYMGQALGTYGGGILQDVNSDTFRAIRSRGGWVEVYCILCPDKLHAHIGYGIDNPTEADLAPGQASRNQTIFANLIWDMTKYFRVAGEFTYRETGYKGLPENSGVGFQTQAQWKF
jgi:hypothetical protein